MASDVGFRQLIADSFPSIVRLSVFLSVCHGKADLGGPWQVAVNRAWVRRIAEGTLIPVDWQASSQAIEAELRTLEAEGSRS